MKKINSLVFIDDDYATNFYHKVIVRDSKLVENFTFFSEPEQALEYFKGLKGQENASFPDAIFLDINMPRIDGWTFLEEYAQIDIKKSPIIIMLSTSMNPSDQEKADNNPMVKGFKNKPLSEEHLVELQAELASLQ
ncbi:MAG: response regulator [Bacteroidota bacterium]